MKKYNMIYFIRAFSNPFSICIDLRINNKTRAIASSCQITKVLI